MHTTITQGRSLDARHPLEPLTANEIKSAVKSLREEEQLGPTIRFVSIVFKESAKAYVKTFHQAAGYGGRPLPSSSIMGKISVLKRLFHSTRSE